MDKEIKEGSMVQLVSGGPVMTVSDVYRDDDNVELATCEWFDGKAAAFRRDELPLCAIHRVEPRDKAASSAEKA